MMYKVCVTKGVKLRRYFVPAVTLIMCSVLVWAVQIARASGADAYRPTFVYIVREVSPAASHEIIERSITSDYADENLALLQNNIQLFKQDKITRYPDQMYTVGGVIVISRAPVIHLTDGKKSRDIRSWAPILSDALNENDVPEIGQDDKVTPDSAGAVKHDMHVVIVRVQKTTVIEKEKIPFVTIQKDDNTLDRGKTNVKQAGHDGVKQKTYAVTREDGVEVSRVLQKTEITTAKEDRLILNGTKLIIGRTFTGTATYWGGQTAGSDQLPRGKEVRVTNLNNGKITIVTVGGCICGSSTAGVVVDLPTSYFLQLGGTLSQGVYQSIKAEEILN